MSFHNERGIELQEISQGLPMVSDRDAASPELKILRVVNTVDFFLK